MSPGNTAQLLSALASPARKREFLRTTENGRPREPPSVALGELLKLPAHAIKRRQWRSLLGDVSRRCCTNGTHTLMGVANRDMALFRIECDGPQSACGSARCRAYPPPWSCGRVAEGGGLLNRYRLVKAYRGFESLRLRQHLRISRSFDARPLLISHVQPQPQRYSGGAPLSRRLRLC